MRRRCAVARLGMLLALSIACTACESEGDFAIPPMDWDTMIVNGRTSTLEEATEAMAFDVIVPTRVGSPDRIVITSPEFTPRRLRLVGFVFADPALGRYWVIEEVSQTSQEELESLADCESAGCEGRVTVVRLPRGIRGVLVEGSIATSVMWLGSGRRFDVVGPAETFKAPSALDVASNVILSES